MDRDDLRVKKMLGCIHENFADNLSLRDVAGAAGISERECLRCFERTIRLSPFQYLLKYRVMRGAGNAADRSGQQRFGGGVALWL